VFFKKKDYFYTVFCEFENTQKKKNKKVLGRQTIVRIFANNKQQRLFTL